MCRTNRLISDIRAYNYSRPQRCWLLRYSLPARLSPTSSSQIKRSACIFIFRFSSIPDVLPRVPRAWIFLVDKANCRVAREASRHARSSRDQLFREKRRPKGQDNLRALLRLSRTFSLIKITQAYPSLIFPSFSGRLRSRPANRARFPSLLPQRDVVENYGNDSFFFVQSSTYLDLQFSGLSASLIQF